MNSAFPYIQKLQVISDGDASLIQLLSWFEQFKPFMPPAIWLQSQIALVEGFTNAVRHSHRDLARETPLDIEAKLGQGMIEIRIWDRGGEFDLKGFMKTLAAECEIEAESGRGLKLITKIVDDLEYIRSDDQRNCLYMIKHWKPS